MYLSNKQSLLLRYNWHAALYKFKIYSKWFDLNILWSNYTVSLVNIYHIDTNEEKSFPYDEKS